MHCRKDSFEGVVSNLGDWIGAESCVDLKTNVDMEEYSRALQNPHKGGGGGDVGRGGGRSSDHLPRKTVKEFPPPIPWLASTENFPCQMPWVMKRYYTDDGRLVIKEEKVKRHEYFRADRSGGRLTLHLVPLDDDESGDDREGNENGYGDSSEGGRGRGDGVRDEDQTASLCMENGGAMNGGGGGGGGGKCFKYPSVSRSSCKFGGVAVAAIESVHT